MFLKEFVEPENKSSYYAKELEYNVQVLESISGILNNDRGNPIGIIVLKSDVDKWDKWYSKKCDSLNQKK